MSRRSTDRSASGTGTGRGMEGKTGGPAGKSALPVICEKIRFYRERAGLEQKELAGRIGVTGNAVSNWENGRGRPDLNLVPRLCEALNTTMYALFGVEDPANQFTEGEQAHIRQYRELTPGHRTAVDHLMENLIQVQIAENVPLLRRLTCYSRSLAAGFGDPTEFEEEGEPIWLYASREVDRADCVFAVSGDSMEPEFHSGDLVLVSRIPDAPKLQPGEIGAFITGNETYIKVYQEDGLYSLNPVYKPMHFQDTDRVYLIGRVTGILDPGQVASEEDVNKYRMRHPV